jgi:hypothetical protein
VVSQALLATKELKENLPIHSLEVKDKRESQVWEVKTVLSAHQELQAGTDPMVQKEILD